MARSRWICDWIVVWKVLKTCTRATSTTTYHYIFARKRPRIWNAALDVRPAGHFIAELDGDVREQRKVDKARLIVLLLFIPVLVLLVVV
jgi:hypothetical protein